MLVQNINKTMPYHIKPVEGGYYVVSESGTYLSKKPLSEARAKKQLTAANLSYLRSKGRIPPRPAEHKQLIPFMHKSKYGNN